MKANTPEQQQIFQEKLEARRAWNNIFLVLKEKNGLPKLLYSAKLFFINEEEIKIFHDNKFMTTKPEDT
jgi:hypothetical protein